MKAFLTLFLILFGTATYGQTFGKLLFSKINIDSTASAEFRPDFPNNEIKFDLTEKNNRFAIYDDEKTKKSKRKIFNAKMYGSEYGINLSYSHQIHSALEIGYIRYLYLNIRRRNDKIEGSVVRGQRYTFAYWNIGSSLDFLLTKKFVMGTRIYSNFTYNFFSSQLNVTAYTDFRSIFPVITPEIGIGRFIGVRYGYNFKLKRDVLNVLGNHKITLFINFKREVRRYNPVKF